MARHGMGKADRKLVDGLRFAGGAFVAYGLATQFTHAGGASHACATLTLAPVCALMGAALLLVSGAVGSER